MSGKGGNSLQVGKPIPREVRCAFCGWTSRRIGYPLSFAPYGWCFECVKTDRWVLMERSTLQEDRRIAKAKRELQQP